MAKLKVYVLWRKERECSCHEDIGKQPSASGHAWAWEHTRQDGQARSLLRTKHNGVFKELSARRMTNPE